MQLRARAKVNLLLRVTRRRDDGYHELLTVFDRISLADELEVDLADEVRVECNVHALEGRSNLAWRAAEKVCAATGAAGLAVRLTKNIPVAAGLGGGSADAAAVLRAGNELTGCRLDEARLRELARELGADVPFFLGGRMAVATGVGDQLTPVSTPPPAHYVLLHPGKPVSTAEVFGSFSAPRGAPPLPSVESVLKTASSGDLERLVGLVYNDLESTALALHPEIRPLRQALEASGALAVALSGSGGTVFGLFGEDEAARNAYDELMRSGHRWTAYRAHGE